MNLMSCIDRYLFEKVYPAKFFSIHCVNKSGLKLNFQSNVFDDIRNTLHCDVECLDCNRRNLPVNVPLS